MISVRNNEKKVVQENCFLKKTKHFSVPYSLAQGRGFSSSHWICDCSHIQGTGEHKAAESWKLLIFFRWLRVMTLPVTHIAVSLNQALKHERGMGHKLMSSIHGQRYLEKETPPKMHSSTRRVPTGQRHFVPPQGRGSPTWFQTKQAVQLLLECSFSLSPAVLEPKLVVKTGARRQLRYCLNCRFV